MRVSLGITQRVNRPDKYQQSRYTLHNLYEYFNEIKMAFRDYMRIRECDELHFYMFCIGMV